MRRARSRRKTRGSPTSSARTCAATSPANRSATCWTRSGCTESGLASDCGALPLQHGTQLLFPEREETLLVRADLMQTDVIEPGIGAFLDRAQIGLGVGSDRHVLGRRLHRDRLRRGFEVRGAADLLGELAPQRAGRP